MSVPGLKRRPRADGGFAWYWIAGAVSRRASEYPRKTIRIEAATVEEAEAQAWQYTAELRMWLLERTNEVAYNGTLGSLIDCYQTDEDSPYRGVRENTRRSYDHDLKILKSRVGDVRVKTLRRKEFVRWHRNFAAPAEENGEPRVRRAHGLMTMVRMLLSFGVSMRYQACRDAKDVLAEVQFEMPAPRRKTLTFELASKVVDEALKVGARSMALGQALQFELGLRQIDVVGTWITDHGQAAGVVVNGKRWTGGLTWADLTAEKLAMRTSKTGQEGVWNPAEYPLLVKVMGAYADDERMGPAVMDERTGCPYAPQGYSRRWRPIADAAGVPADVWNMDSRAGAITEADEAGADPEDTRKFATHANRKTTQRYVRDTSQATSRVAKLRVAFRGRNEK